MILLFDRPFLSGKRFVAGRLSLAVLSALFSSFRKPTPVVLLNGNRDYEPCAGGIGGIDFDVSF